MKWEGRYGPTETAGVVPGALAEAKFFVEKGDVSVHRVRPLWDRRGQTGFKRGRYDSPLTTRS